MHLSDLSIIRPLGRPRRLLVLALVAATASVVAAPAAQASTGFVFTHDDTTTTINTSTGSLLLATTAFTPSINVVAAANPSVDWGDGTRSEPDVVVPFLNCFSQCDMHGSHTYTKVGTYTVTVTYNTGCCVSYTTHFTITVKGANYVIASVGDSVASGEGNPDQVPSGQFAGSLGQAVWDDGLGQDFFGAGATSQCHQSQYAAPTQAAAQIKSDNSSAISVSYTQLACSGASIEDVINKQLPNLPSGHIDALIVSAGANDIDGGFANLFKTCLTEVGLCQYDAAFTSRVASDIADLNDLYAKLAAAIATHHIGQVFITEYFDPTRPNTSNAIPYGDFDTNTACTLNILNSGTWQWAHDRVVEPLNAAVRAAAQTYGWHYVPGIASAFVGHGFCAWTQDSAGSGGYPDNQNGYQHWVVAMNPGTTLSLGNILGSLEANTIEGESAGTAHPNQLGEQVIKNAIVHELYKDALPVTDVAAVATPSSGVAGTTTGPYNFGTPSDNPVQITLSSSTALPHVTVSDIFYSVDDTSCAPDHLSSCSEYSNGEPFQIFTYGQHLLTVFAENIYGGFEAPQLHVVDIVPPAGSDKLIQGHAELVDLDGTTDLNVGYSFGSWTKYDVKVTLDVPQPGQSEVLNYSIDDPACLSDITACKQVTLGTAFDPNTNTQTHLPPFTYTFTTHGQHVIYEYEGGQPQFQVNIDRTNPTITFDGASPAPNSAGWNNTPVTLTWSCKDSESGAQSAHVVRKVSSEGGHQAITGTCTDFAGNIASETEPVNIDLTPPHDPVATADRPSDLSGATNGLPTFTHPITVTATAQDELSGLSSCTSAQYSGPDGTRASVTGTCSDKAGNQVGWSYSFNYTTTPPVLSFLGKAPAPNASGWNNSPVTLSWDCFDPVAAVHTTITKTLSLEGANQTASATCSDSGGLTVSDQQGGVNIDLRPPTATAATDRPPDYTAADGTPWWRDSVTVKFAGSDPLLADGSPGSGVDPASVPAPQTFDSSGAHTATRSVKDRAGNVSAPASLTAHVDATPPVLSATATTAGAPYTSGTWTNHDVTVTFNCTDGESGVASESPPVTKSAEGKDQSVTGTCTDNVGHTTTVTLAGIDIDKTPPTITFSGNGGTYTVDQTVDITCTATDALSGIASTTCADITGPTWTFGLGTTTRSASATDLAGNTTTASTSFDVIVTAISLDNLITQFFGGDKHGANGLIAKVDALASTPNSDAKRGLLGAFDNQVAAKTGDPLTTTQASALEHLAAAL